MDIDWLMFVGVYVFIFLIISVLFFFALHDSSLTSWFVACIDNNVLLFLLSVTQGPLLLLISDIFVGMALLCQ